MYRKRLLESSRETIFGAVNYIHRYNEKCSVIMEEMKKRTTQLFEVQSLKNMRLSLTNAKPEEKMNN